MWAVIDTSVYIGHWERGLYDEALERVRRAFIVRHSAVVLSELRRGARTRAAERTVARLHALARAPWTPNQKDWWEAGRLIRTIGDAHDWDRGKRRDFQNDALIRDRLESNPLPTRRPRQAFATATDAGRSTSSPIRYPWRMTPTTSPS